MSGAYREHPGAATSDDREETSPDPEEEASSRIYTMTYCYRAAEFTK